MKPETHMTIFDLLRDLQKQVLSRIDKNNRSQLQYLSYVLAELEEAAARLNDNQMVSVLDEMGYAVNHTLMGVDFKAQGALPEIERLLSALEADRQTSP